MTDFKIEFEPLGRRGPGGSKESLLESARRLGAGITSLCGGGGTCRRCRIQVLAGDVSEITPEERDAFTPHELKNGWRFACRAYPRSDVRIHVPPESMTTPQRTQTEGLAGKITPHPVVQSHITKISPPTLDAPHADGNCLLATLNQQVKPHIQGIDLGVLRELSPKLRGENWQVRAFVRDREMINVTPTGRRGLGLAVDIGTTKLAAYLMDLESGATLAALGAMNPQISYGEDFVSRINYIVTSSEGSTELREAVGKTINQLAAELCQEAGVETGDIVEAVAVGNTVMHHLYLGLPVAHLIQPPFAPVISQAIDIKARDLGLDIAPGAYVHLLPNLAGFVGGDHIAMLLASGAYKSRRLTIALDIGTNTEVSLIEHGQISSVSCASGPAFEGAHITSGMRAAPGAIERLRLTNDEIEYQTINGAPPVGLCGSGILDTVAQLYEAGIVAGSGLMDGQNPHLRSRHGQREFVIAVKSEGRPAVTVTQQDIRQIQLAKAAIRAGIQVLLETAGRSEAEIERVIIAGAFGSYIDVASAITIGMLPALPLSHFRQVGNAAGTGARMALISRRARATAQRITARARYIELACLPSFTDTFIKASPLGIYRLGKTEREMT